MKQRKSTESKFAKDSQSNNIYSIRIINHSKTTTRLDWFVLPFWCDLLLTPSGRMPVHGDHEGGAAWRRCQRRLRMHWRHEQLTLQMALAAALHHSRDVGLESHTALRSQRTARAGREEENELHFAMGQTTPPPRVAASEYFPVTPEEEVGGVLAAGERPTPLVEVLPQGQVQRHSVVHIADVSPFVSMYLCRSWGTNLWNS